MTSRLQFEIQRADLTPTKHRQVLRQVNYKRGAVHVKQRVPRHFDKNQWTNPVSGGYRYFRRSDRTKAIKARAGADPMRPNFVSGDMMESILNSGRVTATFKQWRWIARNTEFPLATHRRREIEEVAPDELDEDAQILADQYARFANKDKYRRKRRRRVG